MLVRMLLVSIALLAGAAQAACPPCFAGGGPAVTDCFVEWGGIQGASTSCVDGSACDQDGLVDGVCTLALSACINVAGAGCTSTALSARPKVSGKGGSALASALGALDPASQSCTTPGFAVPMKHTPTSLRPGTVRIRVTAASAGKKDTDALKFTCLPGQPRLDPAIQDIFTAKCAIAGGCHDSANFGNLNLQKGNSAAELINVRAAADPKLSLVVPRNLKKSFLATKIAGHLKANQGSPMPFGCPVTSPCLTDAEKLAILSWIASGAQ